MENILFFVSLLSISFSLFNLSFRYSKVNRGFMMIATSSIENNIAIYPSETYIPYYDKTGLEANVAAYLADEVFPYLERPKLRFDYGENELTPSEVNISLEGKLTSLFYYSKTIHFSIKENINE